MSTGHTPQQTVERLLELSRTDGCIVIVDSTSSANLRFAANTLTTNGLVSGRRVTVVATVASGAGVAAGVIGRGGEPDADLEPLVRAAEEAAAQGPPAEDAQPLVEPTGPDDGFAEPPAETAFDVFADLSNGLGEVFGAGRADGREWFGYAEHEARTTYVGSSTGLRLRHVQPSGRVEVNAKSHHRSRSAWVGVATKDFGDVDVTALDEDLRRRLDWAGRRIDLPAGRYETLIPPTAMADLMVTTYWWGSARDAADGRSVFSKAGGGTRVGETLTDVPVTLRSDPARPGLECTPFVVAHASGTASSVFDNGLPLRATTWIDRGRLVSLLQTRYTAGLTGLPVTPVVDNLILEADGADAELSAMVAATSRGLLLTCLWYIREVDPQTLLLTGLTRDGVYLVEDGEVTGAVNNFRFNESPVDLLRRATEFGATQRRTLSREWSDYFNRAAMPAVRVPDFLMSTVSPAS